MFAGIVPKGLFKIAAACHEEVHKTGDYLFREGELGDKLYVVLDGKVRIARVVPGMGEETISVLSSGASFGEMALIDDFPRSADAIVMEKCRVLSLKKDAFAELLYIDRDLANEILWNTVKLLSARMRETNDKMQLLSTSNKF